MVKSQAAVCGFWRDIWWRLLRPWERPHVVVARRLIDRGPLLRLHASIPMPWNPTSQKIRSCCTAGLEGRSRVSALFLTCTVAPCNKPSHPHCRMGLPSG